MGLSIQLPHGGDSACQKRAAHIYYRPAQLDPPMASLDMTSMSKRVLNNFAITHCVHYKQYIVCGSIYAVGNGVAALSNIYSRKKKHSINT